MEAAANLWLRGFLLHVGVYWWFLENCVHPNAISDDMLLSIDILSSNVFVFHLVESSLFKNTLDLVGGEVVRSCVISSSVEILFQFVSCFESELSLIVSSVIAKEQFPLRSSCIENIASHSVHFGGMDARKAKENQCIIDSNAC